MDGHVVHARPVVVTEEKVRESELKQARQKAFREALDLQILEAEKLRQQKDSKARNAGGRRRSSSPRGLASPRSPRSPYLPAKNSPRAHNAQPAARKRSLSGGGGGSPTAHTGGAVPAPPPARYVISFDDGNARFEETASGPSVVSETLVPSKVPKRGNKVAPALAGPAKGRGPTRRTSLEHEVSQRYQTNSLPADFSLESHRPAKATAGDAVADGGGAYDTTSLPVDLIYRINAARGPLNTPPNSASTGQRREGGKAAPASGKVSSKQQQQRRQEALARPTRAESAGKKPTGKKGRGIVNTNRAKDSFLPPLAAPSPLAGGPASDMEVIELSGVLDNMDTPRRGGSPAAGANSNHNNKSNNNAKIINNRRNLPGERPPELLRLQKRLESQDAALRKMAAKEKGWEEQVRRLKEELHNAKVRQPAGTSVDGGGVSQPPRRAETAPEPSAAAHVPVDYPQVPSSAVPAQRPTAEFNRAHIFHRNTFRPVSISSDERAIMGGHADAKRNGRHPYNRDYAAKAAGGYTAAAELQEEENDDDGIELIVEVLHPDQEEDPEELGPDSEEDEAPIALQVGFAHLEAFINAQLITEDEARNLWDFFQSTCEPVPTEGEAAADRVDADSEDEVDEDAVVVTDLTSSAGPQPSVARSSVVEASTHAEDEHDDADSSDDSAADDVSEDEASADSDDGTEATEKEEENDDDDGDARGDYMQVPVSAHNRILAPGLRKKITRKYQEHVPRSPVKSLPEREEDESAVTPSRRSPRLRRPADYENGESNSSTPVGDDDDDHQQLLLHQHRLHRKQSL